MPEVADSRDRRKFSLTTFFTTAPMRRSKPARRYPPVTFGGLLARMFHDWDNSHGLILQGRWKPLRRQPPRGGRRRGIDDIEIAYRLGASGSRLHGQALYRTVRSATAPPITHSSPKPSSQLPQATTLHRTGEQRLRKHCGASLSSAPSAQPWHGSRGDAALRPGVFELPGLLGIASSRRWGACKTGQAYRHGFIKGLAHDPKATVLAIVGNEAASCTDATARLRSRNRSHKERAMLSERQRGRHPAVIRTGLMVADVRQSVGLVGRAGIATAVRG